MLFFSDFLFAQVMIKEKIVINPQQSLQNINIIGEDTTLTSQVLDTTGTIVTVRYRRFCFDTPTGGKAFTQSSPCNAYKDSAVLNQQGIAQYKFIAYDKNALTPYRILGYPGCFTYGSDTLIVTDNRGFRGVSVGYWPLIDYQPSEICVVNNPQPQTLDTTSFEVYKQGDFFADASLPQPIVVDNCGYNVKPGTIRFGLTIPLWFVNMNKVPPTYNVLRDINDINKDPVVCLDNTNPADKRWLFQFKTKVRIPIFSSLCLPSGSSGYTNLGGDSTVWQTTITSCMMYEKAEEAMIYWRAGNYKSNEPVPNKYYFDSMIMAHEETHLEDIKLAIKDSMNKAYYDAFTSRPRTSLYPCARSVIDSWPKQGSKIPLAFGNATSYKKESEQEKLAREKAIDEDLRTQEKREKIYEQFKAWGRSKGWRNQNDNIICP
ncbi:MAG: hypothetical protein QME58_13415 [Bacteroidota bacterium]|nr:hypothetical protein [Bacteroidota bacterium]